MPEGNKEVITDKITKDMVKRRLYAILKNPSSTDVQGQARVAEILLDMISARGGE